MGICAFIDASTNQVFVNASTTVLENCQIVLMTQNEFLNRNEPDPSVCAELFAFAFSLVLIAHFASAAVGNILKIVRKTGY